MIKTEALIDRSLISWSPEQVDTNKGWWSFEEIATHIGYKLVIMSG